MVASPRAPRAVAPISEGGIHAPSLVSARLRAPTGLATGSFLVVLAASPAAYAQTHPPGTDDWTHTGGPPRTDAAYFTSFPLPQGLFAPGSDPYTGIVPLAGSIVGPRNTDTSALVDDEDHVARLLLILDEMVSEGLVTMEKVRVLKYVPGTRPQPPPSAAR